MAKIAEDLQIIETDLEAKVVAAEIDINGDLDFNGWQAVGVSALVLDPVPDPDDFGAGSAIYSQNEWYLVTAAGAVRVTLDGQLDAASLGGIGGDYGSPNPAAVTYVDTDGIYIFTEEPGVYADIEVDDVVLRGASGLVRLACDAAVDTGPTLSINEPPASGTALTIWDSAGRLYPSGVVGSTVSSNQTWTGTNTFNNTLTAVNVVLPFDTGVLTSSGGFSTLSIEDGAITLDDSSVILEGASDVHREKVYETVVLPNIGMKADIDTASIGSNTPGGVLLDATRVIRVPLPVLVGERVLTAKAVLSCVGGTDTCTVNIGYVNASGYSSLYSATQGITATPTLYTFDITNFTFLTGHALSVSFTAPAAQGFIVGPVSILHDRP
jgi:hypothetical protein